MVTLFILFTSDTPWWGGVAGVSWKSRPHHRAFDNTAGEAGMSHDSLVMVGIYTPHLLAGVRVSTVIFCSVWLE